MITMMVNPVLPAVLTMSIQYLFMAESSPQFWNLYEPLLLILAILFVILTLPSVVRKYAAVEVKQTEEHLFMGHDAKIPWSHIEKITVKRSELENLYLTIYFRGSTPPASFDLESFSNADVLVKYLRDNAAVKGFTFTTEEQVKTAEGTLPEAEGFWESMKKREPESIPEGSQKETPKIKLSQRQKFFLMGFLAAVFFLGFYFIIGAKFAVSLFVVVLVHEAGHLGALKIFHLKVHGLFFIPFIGAGVIPRDELPSPEVEAATALGGPLAGLLLNLAAHLVSFRGPIRFSPFSNEFSFLEIFFYIIVLNLALNLFNLMPLLPLDGGRVMKAALLRGRKSLISVAVIAIGCGAVVTAFFESMFLLLITILGLVSLIGYYRKIEEQEIELLAWWKSLAILGVWIAVMCLYWYSLPFSLKVMIKSFIELAT